MRNILKVALIFIGLFLLIFYSLVWAYEGEQDMLVASSFLENFSRYKSSPVDLVTIHKAIRRLGDLGIKESESLMVEILRLEGELKLKEKSHMSEAMSPMETLKAAAITTLEKIGASGQALEIIKVYAETANPALKDIAKKTLEAFGVYVDK